MKKPLIGTMIIVMFGLLMTAGAYSYSTSDSESYIRSTSIRPCDWWSRDSSSNNYVCSNYPFRMQVVEAAEVERVVNDLERKIQALEARITELENPQ